MEILIAVILAIVVVDIIAGVVLFTLGRRALERAEVYASSIEHELRRIAVSLYSLDRGLTHGHLPIMQTGYINDMTPPGLLLEIVRSLKQIEASQHNLACVALQGQASSQTIDPGPPPKTPPDER